MNTQDLPFWHFFQQLEKELSYERWIDKYRLFLDVIFINKIISYDDDWSSFRKFCKILYLQNASDELKFDQLLSEAIVRERELWETALKDTLSKPVDTPELNKSNTITGAPPPESEQQEQEIIKDQPPVTMGMPEPADSRKQRSMYYNPPAITVESDQKGTTKKQINFLLTDEYFPVTRRQMIKGWQFLRQKERSNAADGIDVQATIQKIAREGLFFEPAFKSGVRNREDAVIIFADCRGSMAPFHELTNRLIQTARGPGGHPKAQVFYFQNFPIGYVYKGPNLDKPVKLKEALIKANRNLTLAIVISDAGAARGNNEPKRNSARLEMTKKFLAELDKSCAHTIWLNPMPSHRWKDTAAALIRKEVFLMTPIFDSATYNFQDTFRTILKQNLKNIKLST